MILYFADRKFSILGMASTGTLPKALKFYDDTESQEIEKGSSILTGYLSIEDNLTEINRLTQIGNYLLMQDEDKQIRFYTIIRKEKNRKNREVFIYAEDAGLDLLNEVVDQWSEPAKEQPISYYINRAIYDSGFEIGQNEVSTLQKKLPFSNEETATKRLLAIVEAFDQAEFSFRFEIKGMKVVRKYIDIFQKRGNETQIELRLNRDIDNIVTEETIENLATAFRVYGGKTEGDSEGITLQGYNYDDGRFYVEGMYLLDRQALSVWSRYLSETGTNVGHIVANFNYDTLDKDLLCAEAVKELRKRSEPEINYEVDIAFLPDDVRIGDTVNIVDDEDNLYLQARVLKLERSRSNKKATAVLGNYLIKSSGINQRLQDLADKIQTIKSGDTYFPWIRYADDENGKNISAMPLGKTYMAIKYGLNQPTPSDDSRDYDGLWVKIIGQDGQDGLEGPPGQNGLPTYTWIRYADDVNGNEISENPEGKKYIGIAHNKATLTPSTNPKEYIWSAMYDDEQLKALQNKVEGITYPFTSSKEPSNPKAGQQWWRQDINNPDSITGYFVWDGKKWNPQTIQQSILNIIELNAVKIFGGEITGTVMTGSKIINTFDMMDQGARLVGLTKLDAAKLRMEYVVPETSQSGFLEINPQELLCRINDSDGNQLSAWALSNQGLRLAYGNKIGVLSYDSLIDHDWYYLTLASGLSWEYPNENWYQPKIKKIYIQGKSGIQTAGIIKRTTAGGGDGFWVSIGTWKPSEMLVFPSRDVTITGTIQDGTSAAISFQSNGNIRMRCPKNWTELRWDACVIVQD
ncbi:phage tail protein [Enterococcus sp. BWT-B8]|uniref:phage tail spike protein n=1 Tax=Enterococcus sp. BWT-B8 TaxID=2885157 RepID=UPI001E2D03A6|nr:phage tail spike protein [Enterococcus sp. BWT-B8]MCB5952946.1 phage tail protein [Enterococcus sp. BWT-B8]